MDITRRQFTSICAASLAVPGMLPLQPKVKSFSELCNEDYLQYRRSVTHCLKCKSISYYSPTQEVDVPYKDKFIIFDVDEDQFKFVWGHTKVYRTVSFDCYPLNSHACDMVVLLRDSWEKTQLIDPEKEEESILGKTVGYKIL